MRRIQAVCHSANLVPNIEAGTRDARERARRSGHPRVTFFLKRGLEAEGFAVRTTSDGAEGLNMSRSLDFDLIVLDLPLPSVSGAEILATLRAAGSTVPVIVLTDAEANSDGVDILNAGADDYLTRPCDFDELLARIRARLRTADQTVSTPISQGRVTIDVITREVRIGGRSVDLRPREFALLETMMHHRGQVLSQAQLLNQVWGYDRDPTSNVVEVYVGYLRKKLRRDVVETVRGAGYRFRG
jgi:DNA-binding response OmpR family regulator